MSGSSTVDDAGAVVGDVPAGPSGGGPAAAMRPRAPRTAQPRTMPGRSGDERPARRASVCMTVHAASCRSGVTPSQSTVPPAPAASALPIAVAPAGDRRGGGLAVAVAVPGHRDRHRRRRARPRPPPRRAAGAARRRSGGRSRAQGGAIVAGVGGGRGRSQSPARARPASIRMSRSVRSPWTDAVERRRDLGEPPPAPRGARAAALGQRPRAGDEARRHVQCRPSVSTTANSATTPARSGQPAASKAVPAARRRSATRRPSSGCMRLPGPAPSRRSRRKPGTGSVEELDDADRGTSDVMRSRRWLSSRR